MDEVEAEMERQRLAAAQTGKYTRECIHWRSEVPRFSRPSKIEIEYLSHHGCCAIRKKEDMLCKRVDASDCPDFQKKEHCP